MSDVIKFPNTTNQIHTALPKSLLISLLKARSFEEYNNQFIDPNYVKTIVINDDSNGAQLFNSTSKQGVTDYLNRDNAEVLHKNRIVIAHKISGENIYLWSKTAFCQFYKHETIMLFYGFQFCRKSFEIAKLWLESPQRRRYNSYDEYLKS